VLARIGEGHDAGENRSRTIAGSPDIAFSAATSLRIPPCPRALTWTPDHAAFHQFPEMHISVSREPMSDNDVKNKNSANSLKLQKMDSKN
jgi:hypothetical protein